MAEDVPRLKSAPNKLGANLFSQLFFIAFIKIILLEYSFMIFLRKLIQTVA